MNKLQAILNKIFFLSWINKIFASTNSDFKKANLIAVHPILTKNLSFLEKRLQGALHFLKNTRISKNGHETKLNHLPWYLLTGSIGSGKTTFLANSNIPFILEKQFKQPKNHIPSSDSCDWWVTRDVVIVDIPGRYTTITENKASLANKLWEHFLELLQKNHSKQNLSGVVMALSLTELMQKENREHFFFTLTTRIKELTEKFGSTLPFYFIITKCDLLPGFLDFFRDCGQDELAQTWGVSLPLSQQTALTDVFDDRFNLLIKRLNKQLIWRLHHERNPHAKLFIKDFPLQLEKLKESIRELLNHLQNNITIHLKGVYLTSALQPHAADEYRSYPQTVSSHEFQQMLQIMHHPSQPSQPYFIKHFILHALAPQRQMENKYANQHPLIYGAIASSILMTALFLGIDLFHHVQPDSSITAKMAQQEVQNNLPNNIQSTVNNI